MTDYSYLMKGIVPASTESSTLTSSSSFSRDDLARHGPGTVGGIFYRQLIDNDLQVDIVPNFVPRNDYEYFQLCSGQIRDLEHILGGGSFDFIGELIPHYMRLTNLSLDLADAFGVLDPRIDEDHHAGGAPLLADEVDRTRDDRAWREGRARSRTNLHNAI